MIEIGTLADVPGSAAVEIAAGEFADVATQLDGAMDAVASGWTGLAAEDVYDGPGADRVYAAMDAPKKVAQMVAAEAKNARRVLDDYASTLADLATRRAALASDVDAHTSSMDDTFDDEDSIGARDTPGGRLADDMAKFNRDVAAADEDCARRLRALAKYRAPHEVDAALHVLSGDVSSSAMGVGQGISQRIRIVPVATSPDFEEPAQAETMARWQNHDYGTRPGSPVLVPRELAQAAMDSPPPVIETIPHLSLSDDPSAGLSALPAVAKTAGHVLGGAGIVMTVAAAGSEQYEEDLRTHPEWDGGHRFAHAAENAGIVGGATALGGWAGAATGAEIGAAIGSVVPGPGTLIGGIFGGVIGGLVGGHVGEDAGGFVMSSVDGEHR